MSSSLMAKLCDNLRYCRDRVLVHATPFLLKHSSYELPSSSEFSLCFHWLLRGNNTTRYQLWELQEAGGGDHTVNISVVRCGSLHAHKGLIDAAVSRRLAALLRRL
jgi:hypothetical protein